MTSAAAALQGVAPLVNPAPTVEATGIAKSFGPTIALHEAGIRVMPQESHALVGRNGAGKSTLVSILTGLVAADSGSLTFGGVPAPGLSDRAAWRELVACVYQHSTIIPDLSVAENLFIGRQPTRRGLIDWKQMRRDADLLLAQWGVEVPVDRRAGDLNVESRQMVEIARALSRGARFIILDEPTAQLDGDEIRRLFRRIRELQQAGITFLFISHHLQEIYEICQTVTVMRDARHIVTAPVSEMPKQRLIEVMTGEVNSAVVTDARHRVHTPEAAEVVAVEGLSGRGFEAVGFSIRAGEILGLAGTTSSGRTEIAETIAGLKPVGAGRMSLHGKPMRGGVPAQAIAAGIGCVPKSRHDEGLVLHLPVGENATMTVANRLGKFGFQAPRAKQRAGQAMIDALGIVTQGTAQPVSGLSGGNQQKVVMARALASNPELLVLIDPTVGVDVKSKVALLGHVEQCRVQGKAILLSSSETDDLRICDRVLVLCHGKITCSFDAGWSEAELIAAMEGMSAA